MPSLASSGASEFHANCVTKVITHSVTRDFVMLLSLQSIYVYSMKQRAVRFIMNILINNLTPSIS